MATLRTRQDAILLLRAYRTLGKIADQVLPSKAYGPSGRMRSGNGLLKDHGLSDYEAAAAIWLGRLSDNAFQYFLDMEDVPKPWTASNNGRKARPGSILRGLLHGNL